MKTKRYRPTASGGCYVEIIDRGFGSRRDRIGLSIPRFLHIVSVDRVAILRRMAGAGPMTVAEAARLISRPDERDIELLIDAGLVERCADGRVVCRVARIEIEIDLVDDQEA